MQKLTCLMTTFNETADVLRQSIDSILSQTYTDFKFLVVVDNPENSQAIYTLEEYSKSDRRLQYIINEKNLGLPEALNRGIDLIFSKYIARMDADDIAIPNRFQKQLTYMEEHPDVDLVGAFVTYIDNQNNVTHSRYTRPSKPEHINECMKYINTFAHPTLMGKTSIFKKIRYRNLQYSQDYDFTCRLIECGYRLENIPDVLLQYRVNSYISDRKIAHQRIIFCSIQEFFRKEQLCSVDIVSVVQERITKANIKKVAESVKHGEYFFECARKKVFLKALRELLMAMKGSSFQRRYMFDIFWYVLLKYRLNF